MMPTPAPTGLVGGHDRAMLLVATADDVGFLTGTLIDAAFRPGDRPAEPLADPAVAHYIDRWGRPGDHGLVAWSDGEPVGAAWTRLFEAEDPGYGFVAPDVPELTVAVREGLRGRGLGRALVMGAVDQAGAAGASRVSLSVADSVNPRAHALYRALGFTEVGRDPGGSLTMVTSTRPAPPSDRGATETVSARMATPADALALLRLREEMFRAMGLDGDASWAAAFVRIVQTRLADGTMLAAVVDGEDGRPVTSAIAQIDQHLPKPGRPDGRDVLVSSVSTDPAWRGRGLASACVAALQAALRGRGITEAHLTAADGATGVYARLGFADRAGHAMRWRDRT